MIAIEAIKFNHDTNTGTHDALNIRQNATQFISVPEWRRFTCVNPEDSRAVYAVAPTQGNPITIQVSLSSTDPSTAFVEVRVQHHVKARPVNFINGKTGIVTFELIEFAGPERIEFGAERGHPPGVQAVVLEFSCPPARDEPAAGEHAQVLRDRRPAHGEVAG